MTISRYARSTDTDPSGGLIPLLGIDPSKKGGITTTRVLRLTSNLDLLTSLTESFLLDGEQFP